QNVMPGRSLIIRPGLIVGPNDPTDRFSYWPARVARGGRYLAPVRPGYLTQFIDVRDLADWTIAMVEGGATGVFNATGPETPLALGDLLATCAEVAGVQAEPVWVDRDFLQQHEIQPWMEMPLWVPEDPDSIGFSQISIARALSAGLQFRPLRDTVVDTLAWLQTRPADQQWRAGLSAEREAELLRLR
ncbi:MAG: epimerase, partial [Oscillochloris sp.]|nr:epimerase [Oscillochloris sp.]